MFILKFHIKGDDYWEVYTTEEYRHELDETDEGIPVRRVMFDERTRVISRHPQDFDACYVVNEQGNTVDRVHPPKETENG